MENNAVRIDLGDSQIDFPKYEINKEDMVLIAMPCFGVRCVHGDQKGMFCPEGKRAVPVMGTAWAGGENVYENWCC